MSYKYVGHPTPRKEDPKLLTGRAGYIGDVVVPGMLHAAVLRSPHAHARIRSIDASAARALPGVVCVLTGPEALQHGGPMAAFCAEPVPQTAIATEKVRYPGEAVAVIAATDRYIAEDARALIEVDYEVLEPVVDPIAAMTPAAARVHDTLDSNVVFHRSLDFGDVEGDFARSATVVRRTGRWHRMCATPLETAGALASWDPYTGAMTVWSNSNFYNFLPWVFAGILGVPTNRLRLIPCTVGGSFGSKHLIMQVVAIAGALSKATGRPVRYLEDRFDNLAANDNTGPDRHYDAQLAFSAEGEMLSLKLKIIDDYGAYFQFAHGQHGNAMAQPTGPYRIGSLRYDVACVLTNKVQQGFFRGAGADPGNFILERLVDAAAEELGIDGVELRRRNFIQPDEFPYKIPTGNVYDSGNYAAVLDRALEIADLKHWKAEQERLRAAGRYLGIGLASCQERTGYNASEWWFLYDNPPLPATSTPESVKLQVDAMGGVLVELGCPLWGNSPETVVSQVIGEEFGIDPAGVAVTYADSTTGAMSAGPGGSRLTIMLSGAARGAARTIRDKMTRIAAHAMEMSPDDVECVDGTFRAKGAPGTSMTMGEVAMRAHLFAHDNPEGESSGLVDTHTYDHPYATPPNADRTDMGAFYPMVSHACHIPIVEVDPETGHVTLLKYYAVNDCGTIMNPPLVEGQIMGGIVQGIGAALMEQYDYREDGTLGSASLREYLIPTLNEVPDIVVEHVQTPSPFTEYGVKGAGEGGRLVAPTAIASAVSDALRPLGVFIDELPMTPERIVAAVQAAPMTAGVGPAGAVPDAARLRAAALVRTGRQYSLAAVRFNGMPLFPGHPTFQVVSYRTPHGLEVGRENLWAPAANDVGLGCMTELLTATSHSGAHIDALAHMTVGEDAHWYGGANAAEHLGDFGPTVGDAAALPPLFTRGVLLDVAGHRGVECLPAGSVVDADEVAAIARDLDIPEIREHDVVLFRTGYMGLWPDAARMAEHRSPGPDLSAADWLLERGVIAVGSDTETFEVQPAPDPGVPANPQPVHTRLLIESGVYIMESLDLERLAADRVHEFLFIALPLKIAGATGSMVDPLAVV